jgi:signal peptidase I
MSGGGEDTPAEAKLEQLRIAFVRDVLPDLVPQIRGMAQSFKIPNGGMAPSLLAGDHFIVNKLAYKDHAPHRGDIVVFKFPEDESKTFVKRIVGLPKDALEIRDKIVYLNNQVLREDDYAQHLDPKIIEKTLNPRDNIGPLIVPDDCYFVLGDNREESLDSRFWGFLKRDKIIGKVSLIYWSWDDAAKTARWDRAGQRIK